MPRSSVPPIIRLSLSLCALLASPEAASRVVSHVPVTEASAVPAVQSRSSRYYLLIERDRRCPTAEPPIGSAVLFDSAGVEPPRTILPLQDGRAIGWAAYREDPDGTQQVLIAAEDRSSDDERKGRWRYLYSRDGGREFVALDPALSAAGLAWTLSTPFLNGQADQGGPICHGALAGVRIGSKATPFVFLTDRGGSGFEVVAVSDSGSTRRLFPAAGRYAGRLQLTGSNDLGTSFLVAQSESGGEGLFRFDLEGTVDQLVPVTPDLWFKESILTRTGTAYVKTYSSRSGGAFPEGSTVSFLDGGSTRVLAGTRGAQEPFAVLNGGGDGAWIVDHAADTTLFLHTKEGGLVEQWRDERRPWIEALHVARSGKRVMVQALWPEQYGLPEHGSVDPTHRALAIWETGTPAPRSYDELRLVHRESRGFVNLDVDRVADGGAFVFDGGEHPRNPEGWPSAYPPSVLTEQIVRGALVQRLVIPSVARAAGLNGSRWRTDVYLRNPGDRNVTVALRFVPTAGGLPHHDRSIRLEPQAIVLLKDILAGTFGLDSGSGALHLTPEPGFSIEATSRIHTESPRGSLGTGVPAFEISASTHAQATAYFSAGLHGDGFRTNLVAARTSGTGGDVLASVVRPAGDGLETPVLRLDVPAGGHGQANDLAKLLGIGSDQRGAVKMSPEAGEVLGALFVVDNGTNDPTMFEPDHGVSSGRDHTIPAIVHENGVNGASFRSDLYLANPWDQPVSVRLTATSWAQPGLEETRDVTLSAGETRVMKDVLRSVFGASGVASLLLRTAADDQLAPVIRVASRTYAAAPEGTYALSVPPLGPAQRAGEGEVLEILGAAAGAGFRTNLALLDLSGWTAGSRAHVAIYGDGGRGLGSFFVELPRKGGRQINDLFASIAVAAPEVALIRISVSRGKVGAYATLIDNGTNDPSYFGASVTAEIR